MKSKNSRNKPISTVSSTSNTAKMLNTISNISKISTTNKKKSTINNSTLDTTNDNIATNKNELETRIIELELQIKEITSNEGIKMIMSKFQKLDIDENIENISQSSTIPSNNNNRANSFFKLLDHSNDDLDMIFQKQGKVQSSIPEIKQEEDNDEKNYSIYSNKNTKTSSINFITTQEFEEKLKNIENNLDDKLLDIQSWANNNFVSKLDSKISFDRNLISDHLKDFEAQFLNKVKNKNKEWEYKITEILNQFDKMSKEVEANKENIDLVKSNFTNSNKNLEKSFENLKEHILTYKTDELQNKQKLISLHSVSNEQKAYLGDLKNNHLVLLEEFNKFSDNFNKKLKSIESELDSIKQSFVEISSHKDLINSDKDDKIELLATTIDKIEKSIMNSSDSFNKKLRNTDLVIENLESEVKEFKNQMSVNISSINSIHSTINQINTSILNNSSSNNYDICSESIINIIHNNYDENNSYERKDRIKDVLDRVNDHIVFCGAMKEHIISLEVCIKNTNNKLEYFDDKLYEYFSKNDAHLNSIWDSITMLSVNNKHK